ncbi:4Fe-4S binding protein [bacterium]|nr:4Fe-4S binding protein [bacterium]
MKLTIDKDWCKGCEICVITCPKHLIRLSDELNSSGYHYAVIHDYEHCTGCSICAIMCPDMAIQIWTTD